MTTNSRFSETKLESNQEPFTCPECGNLECLRSCPSCNTIESRPEELPIIHPDPFREVLETARALPALSPSEICEYLERLKKPVDEN